MNTPNAGNAAAAGSAAAAPSNDLDETVVTLDSSDVTSTNKSKDLDSMSKTELKSLLGEMSDLTQTITSLTIFDSVKQEQAKNPEEGGEDDKPDQEQPRGRSETAAAGNDADSPEMFADEVVPLRVEGMANKDTPDGDEGEWHQPFSESCYTLLYMCDRTTQGFWFGLWCVAIQILTITLVLVDIVDWDSADNPLKIPPMVGTTVTIAQAVAVYMAVPFMSDLIEAVIKLHDGFYPELLAEHPEANFASWLLSCVAQMIAGCLLLVDIFILTMQAQDVIGIMLNFAALHFMAEIDDLGFKVAKMGFVTDALQEQADECLDFKVPKRDKGFILRRVAYMIALCGMLFGYGILKHRQMSGDELATYLYVQFGDVYDPNLGYYSGVLKSDVTYTGGYRRYKDIGTSKVHLGYCAEEGAWTFTWTEDPCDDGEGNIFAKSEPSSTYDVTSIQDYQWLVLDKETNRFTSFESFKLVDRDCDTSICNGQCVDEMCQCSSHSFGLDCEYENVCPELAIGSGSPFPPDTEGYAVSQEYTLLTKPGTSEPVRVYNMPVYYSDSTLPANYIFYGGLRWVITNEWDPEGMTTEEMALSGVHFPADTAEYLSSSFHGHHEKKHQSNFLSDPMHFQSSVFQPTPAGLGWWVADPIGDSTNLNRATEYAQGEGIDAVLKCQNCNLGGSCDPYGGSCDDMTGLCVCKKGYAGQRCDIQPDCFDQVWPCDGDGVCDLGSGECRCNTPYYGKLCEWKFFCVEEDGKCHNDGICKPSNVTDASFFCECVDPATSGSACERRKDCRAHGCKNGGTCDERSGVCNCSEPFYGVACDLISDSDPELLCRTNDDCVDGSCNRETGVCACEDAARYGVLCENAFNCSVRGCKNDGVCNATHEICFCEAPFTGRDCDEVPDCVSDNDCIGGGTCDTDTGSCKCDRALAAGKLCEKDNNCAIGGCYNEGKCQPSGICDCEPGFHGARCDLTLEPGSF